MKTKEDLASKVVKLEADVLAMSERLDEQAAKIRKLKSYLKKQTNL